MRRELRRVQMKFIALIVGVTAISVIALGAILYQTNTIRFGEDISSSELQTVVQDESAVVEYLEQEKDFEAHFITIANLVRVDLQENLGQTLLIITAVILLASSATAFIVARILMKPVRDAYDSQERFLQDAAHELRNPLATMRAAVQNTKPKTKDEKDFVRTVTRQTNRLINLNEDLLYLERHSAEAIEEENLSNLLYDTLEELQTLVVKKKLSLKTDIQDDVMYKMTKEDFIKVARNLLENAIKYTPTGGNISVSLAQDSTILMIVKDSGIGIPENEQSHLGERFYRAKNAQKHDGTGLGLAIVKKVLNVYGGSMDISSKVNKGTTVEIEL